MTIAVAACAANPNGESPDQPSTETPAPTDVPVKTATVPPGPGANSSVEMYIRSEVLREYQTNGVVMCRPDGTEARVGVAQTELANLQITGTVDGLPIRSADVKGGSARFELGATMKPDKNSPWSLDLNVAGFAGKKQGFTGGVSVAFMF